MSNFIKNNAKKSNASERLYSKNKFDNDQLGKITIIDYNKKNLREKRLISFPKSFSFKNMNKVS